MSKIVAAYKNNIRIFKETGLYLLASIIPMVLLVVINPFLAKSLSPYDYAIIGYIGSFAALETPLIQFFIIRYFLSRYYKVDENERAKIKGAVIQMLVIFSFFMSCLVTGGICFYHYTFNRESSLPLFPFLAFSIGSIWVGGLFNFQLAEYRISRKVKDYFYYCTANGVFKVVCLLVCVVILHQGAWGYEFATFVATLLFFLITFYRFRLFLFVPIDFDLIRRVFFFCWPLALAGCLEFFTNGYSRVLLERVGNNTEYGIYCVGDQFARYINVFTMALYSTFNPDIYESVAQHNNRKLFKVSAVMIGASIVVTLSFIILAPFIIDILTAGRYVAATRYAQILSVAQIFIVGFYLINDISVAEGYPKIVLSTKIIASVISIFMLDYIVYRWEFYGAAYGQILTFIVFILINAICLFYAKRNKLTSNG